MFNKLNISTLTKTSKVCGLHARIIAEDKQLLDYALLKKEKGQLVIQEKATGIKKLEQISEKLTNIPVILSVEGKGILTKKVSNPETKTDQELLDLFLPNAKTANFYLQKTRINAGESFITIARKAIIENLLTSFGSLHKQVIELCLGPFNMVVMDPLIPAADHVVQSNQDEIKIQDGIIIEITKKKVENPQQYTLGDQSINSVELLPYANAIGYFSAKTTQSGVHLDAVYKNKEELQYKLIIKHAGRAVLGLLFLLLLINYLLFDSQDKKNKSLNEQFRQNEYMISKITELSESMLQKEDFIAQNDILQQSNLYYYADRIAFLLPDNISLTRMQINPLQRKIKRNKFIDFTRNTISIEGYTRQSVYVNNWIDVLKKEKWVKKVSILNYQKEQGKQTGDFNFDIEFYE